MEILTGFLVLVIIAVVVLLEIFLFPVIGFLACLILGLPDNKDFWNFRDWLVGNVMVTLFLGISYLIGSIIL